MISMWAGAWILAVVWLPGNLGAAESKVDKMTSDQTQARYQRKSMTYLGASPGPGVQIGAEWIQAIVQAVRPELELLRFDYNEVSLQPSQTLDQWTNELREYVQKRAVDRAAAEAQYQERFKRAHVLFTDIDRIMNSAYIYTLEIAAFQSVALVCNIQQTDTGPKEVCVPGDPSVWPDRPLMQVSLRIRAPFSRANLTDASQPLTLPVATIEESANNTVPYEGPPKPPDPPTLPQNATDEQQSQANQQYLREMEAYQQLLANYRERLPQLQREASLQATSFAASMAAPFLSKQLKQIPEFQLKAPVTAALPDGVEFMLGEREGLRLDDSYDVTEFNAAKEKQLLGYVKVREVGQAKGSGEGTPSYAEKVKERRDFVGGELLFEHPMVGFDWDLFFGYELALKDFFGRDQMMHLLGGGMAFDFDVANAFGWPELYFSMALSYWYVGDDGQGANYQMGKFLMGFLKKWYAVDVVLITGLQGGISGMFNAGSDDSESGNQSETAHLALGGELILGLEYYVSPEFSWFVTSAGRYFHWLTTSSLYSMEPEIGLELRGGFRFGF